MKPFTHSSSDLEAALSEEDEESVEPEASQAITTLAVILLMSAFTALSMASGDYSSPQIAEVETPAIKEEIVEETSPKETSEADATVFPSTEVEKSQQKPKQITDSSQLERLGQKLYSDLDRAWTIPMTATSIYLVRVDEAGVITTYTPINSIAEDNLENTPFPELMQPNVEADAESRVSEYAEFEVIFSETGVLEVQPHTIKLDSRFQQYSPNQT
ncbi:MAG: hypothetical protein SWJ54_01830 [Cyanobacteriota bacterium]|nr:hypothetical protein [Cyanobacteriota bacterium]